MKPTDSVFKTLPRDLTSGIVVFLVALPLCLGVALASGAPLISGLLSGIIGGILVGALSGSHSSVSGPAAGLTAVVAAQIVSFGSFQTFLLAVVLAGVIQIILGVARLGIIAEYMPSSVIKGLLSAIGIILILRQLPSLFGYHAELLDEGATISAWDQFHSSIHPGASVIGLLSVVLLVVWDRWMFLKKSYVPAPLAVVLLGVILSLIANQLGARFAFDPSRLVQVPVAKSMQDLLGFLQWPDFSHIFSSPVYVAALTIAIVASLETLLNLEAVDKIDPQKRISPPNRELVAQGIGNVVSGMIGGLPITSVIVRSSVNLNAGARTKCSAIFHGVLLIGSLVLLPGWLNRIPLSCLAAILIVTGFKLASPKLLKQMWSEGRYQFIPFIVTVFAIVATDLLIGVLIGLAVSLFFILHSNLRSPIRRIMESTPNGDRTRIELPNQVSFLNRAALVRALHEVPRGGHVVLDGRATHYIDPDVLDLIRDFQELTDPPYDVVVTTMGFNGKYGFVNNGPQSGSANS